MTWLECRSTHYWALASRMNSFHWARSAAIVTMKVLHSLSYLFRERLRGFITSSSHFFLIWRSNVSFTPPFGLFHDGGASMRKEVAGYRLSVIQRTWPRYCQTIDNVSDFDLFVSVEDIIIFNPFKIWYIQHTAKSFHLESTEVSTDFKHKFHKRRLELELQLHCRHAIWSKATHALAILLITSALHPRTQATELQR